MPTGYTFRGKGSTKDVRQFINKEQVFPQKGANMTGFNVAVNIAQDHVDLADAQTDTRLQYNIYDQELAKETNNQKGVDNTVALSKNQWAEIEAKGETIEHDGKEYIAYQSDVIFTDKGAIPNTKTITPMDVAFDKAKHDELTQGARTARKEAQTKAPEIEVEVEDVLEP